MCVPTESAFVVYCALPPETVTEARGEELPSLTASTVATTRAGSLTYRVKAAEACTKKVPGLQEKTRGPLAMRVIVRVALPGYRYHNYKSINCPLLILRSESVSECSAKIRYGGSRQRRKSREFSFETERSDEIQSFGATRDLLELNQHDFRARANAQRRAPGPNSARRIDDHVAKPL